MKEIVVKDYNLINAKYKVSATQSKIILKVVSMINNKIDTEFELYQIPFSHFDFLIADGHYGRLKKECENLLTKVLKIEKENGNILMSNWFSSIEYMKDKCVIECSIDPKLKPYLLQLKKNFKYYELYYIMKMKSEYSIRIYELLKQYEKFKKRKFKLIELHEILQVPKSYTKKYIDFRVKVLEMAQKEINKYSDIKVSYEAIKRGRAVYWVEFDIKQNENNIIQYKAEENEIKNEEIKNLEEFKVLFAKFKFDLKDFDNEFNCFKIYNKNRIEKITIDNFMKWCMQKKRKLTEKQAINDTEREQKNYRWNFRKAKDTSDKIKFWLQFDKGIDWMAEYYYKDIPMPGFGWQKVMHPDFNKDEMLLYKLDSDTPETKYLLDNKNDDILDIEII